MADDNSSSDALGTVDKLFERLSNYVTRRISVFVAFLFFIFTLGSVYGSWIIIRKAPLAEILIIIPALMGLLAYYNRSFATAIFGAIILLFVIF